MLIGLNGYAGSGKDVVGGVLVHDHGYTRAAVSDPLERLIRAVDPYIASDDDGTMWRVSQYPGIPYETLKDIGDARPFLQRLGRALIAEFGDDVLIARAFEGVSGPIVSTSIRYPAEVDWLRARGGFIVRVDRPGVGPANGDVSETALDGLDFDHRINNDGTLADLSLEVGRMLEALAERTGLLPLG